MSQLPITRLRKANESIAVRIVASGSCSMNLSVIPALDLDGNEERINELPGNNYAIHRSANGPSS